MRRLLLLLFLVTVPFQGAHADAPGPVDFRRDIRPLFEKHCFSCHGPERQRSGLRLDDRTAALEGGDSGRILVPGKAKDSKLYRMVAGLERDGVMPPRGRTPLSKEELALLARWIDQGAPWPQEPAGKTVAQQSDHWAFQPIRRPPVPQVRNAKWVRTPIDAFVLAELERLGWSPSPEADPATLLRRLHFDLTGLPPTLEEADVFLKAWASDPDRAYADAVERLLASPHYAERWTRHWLDLARYADSDGYEQDRERPWAWRWRDWVLDALARDLPFDRFTLEQLAGDLLPGASPAQKIATGFHRNTLTNREGGTDKEQFRVEAVVDRVNTTGKVWLGLTLGCAQCHDHKYDPISQREFYRFFAFFNSDEEVDLPAPLIGREEDFRKAQQAHQAKRAELVRSLDAHRQARLAAWLKQQEKAADLAAPLRKILAVPAAKRTPAQMKQLADAAVKGDARFAALTKALTAHDKNAPKPPVAPTLALGKGRKTHVLLRGDFLRPGVQVQANTPGVLPPIPADKEGRTRLDLARWLVADANPLTPRVIVNWVWHRYFGRGLVATLEDFGTQGEKPSHPDLLDWLASEFKNPSEAAPGTPWSLKRLHRLLVTSAVYRQTSAARTPDLAAKDPYNVKLARQNRLRLEAEILRDNALAVSGLLVRKVGGPSVKPPQPAGVSEVTYANRARWVESKGEDRYRRGLYTWFQRTSPYPMLTMFDAPDGVVCTVRREKSNTPLQALTLLNDRVFVEAAQALAARVAATNAPSTSERIQHAFRLCLTRAPNPRENDLLQSLFDDLRAAAAADPKETARLAGTRRPPACPPEDFAAWVALSRALMNLDEFVTRE